MQNFGTIFTSGASADSPDATYEWSATATQDTSGDWNVLVTCLYGGGNEPTIPSQSGLIPWGTTQAIDLPSPPDPKIGVSGSVTVSYGTVTGGDFAVTFNGSMTLAQGAFGGNCMAETIAGSAILVAGQIGE